MQRHGGPGIGDGPDEVKANVVGDVGHLGLLKGVRILGVKGTRDDFHRAAIAHLFDLALEDGHPTILGLVVVDRALLISSPTQDEQLERTAPDDLVAGVAIFGPMGELAPVVVALGVLGQDAGDFFAAGLACEGCVKCIYKSIELRDCDRHC